MKKGIIFALILVGALMLTACAGPKVNEEAAKKIAAEDAGQDVSSVQFSSVSMESNNGVTKYAFTFGNDDGEWEYELDGDGNITGSKETLYEKVTEAEKQPETQPETKPESQPETQPETTEAVVKTQPETEAAAVAASEAVSDDPFDSVMYNTGDPLDNPVADPYLVYNNVGVDQTDFINEVKDSGYCHLYERDDDDLYVFDRGLSRYLTDSDASFMQLFMYKDTYLPYKISYVDMYEDIAQFEEDFQWTEKAMEEIYGAPTKAGYMDADGNEHTGAVDELLEDIGGIQDAGGGYAFIIFDTGYPAVSLNATYDDEEGIFRIFVDFE